MPTVVENEGTMQTGHGASDVAEKQERNSVEADLARLELQGVREISGAVRIDDATEDAPLLRIEFSGVFDKLLSDEERDQILDTVADSMIGIFMRKNGSIPSIGSRRAAVQSTKERKCRTSFANLFSAFKRRTAAILTRWRWTESWKHF